MTDRIDLDEFDDESPDGGSPDDGPNRGDWFWEDGDASDPDGETDPRGATAGRDDDGPGDRPGPIDGEDAPRRTGDVDGDDDADADGADERPVPHVPRERRDRPVGVPTASGGAGAGPSPDRGSDVPDEERPGTAADRSGESGDASGRPGGDASGRPGGDAPVPGSDAEPAASGPHGGGADDMTMALTYRAATRLADPGRVFADASRWADWIGIVGDVDAHVITKFQRDHAVDADFFNGTGTGPVERLRGVDERSMFYADRMAVVGVADADERIAAAAGWEFVPLAEAAEKAGWTLDRSSE
ncbi:MAG: hypothetical protein ABEJ61_08540 [Haloferacaceae archaeon]